MNTVMKVKKELNIQIGKRIHSMREQRSLTQEKLAELLDVSVQYVSDLERGVVGASLKTIIKISEILDISTDYLLKGKTVAQTGHDDRVKSLNDNQTLIFNQGVSILLEALTTNSGEND